MDAQKRAEYVERWARLLELQGEPRIAGRLYAHLATAEEPYLSLQQLAEQLGVSRASVSTNTRRLIALHMVTKVAVPGSRGEHYALNPDAAVAMLEHAAQAARAIVILAEEGLDLQRGAITPGTQSLRAIRDIYGGLADDFARRARSRSASGRSSSRKKAR